MCTRPGDNRPVGPSRVADPAYQDDHDDGLPAHQEDAMSRFRSTVLTTGALLAAVLPLTALTAAPVTRADTLLPADTPTVTQEPGHPLILYPGRAGTAAAYCPQGTRPTGGGATVQKDPAAAVFLYESAPLSNGWRVRAYNKSDEVHTVHPRVICTTDPSVTQQIGPDVPVQPGEGAEYSTAECGAQYTVGGGGQAGNLTFLSMLDIPGYPMARRWNARAKYTDFDPDAPPSFVRAVVTCADT
jgi:hypothetical protein